MGNGCALPMPMVRVYFSWWFMYTQFMLSITLVGRPNENVWLLGIALLLLMVITAFIGYVPLGVRCHFEVLRLSLHWPVPSQSLDGHCPRSGKLYIGCGVGSLWTHPAWHISILCIARCHLPSLAYLCGLVSSNHKDTDLACLAFSGFGNPCVTA